MGQRTFTRAPVELEGIEIWTASPLALYQVRAGIASQGSFGALSEQQRQSLARLRERFFPDRSEDALLPRIEPMA